MMITAETPETGKRRRRVLGTKGAGVLGDDGAMQNYKRHAAAAALSSLRRRLPESGVSAVNN